MADPATLRDLDREIAVARENLRELTERAAALSGAGDEELAAERIARLQQALETLVKERETLVKEREALRKEHEALLKEREALLKEREALLKEREGLEKRRPTRS